MKKRKSHPRLGNRFEDFLRDDGRLEEATAIAIKRVLAWEIQRAMQAAGVSQAEMARRMKTSRAAVRRLLDDKDPSVTLATISRAALALGGRWSSSSQPDTAATSSFSETPPVPPARRRLALLRHR